MLIMHMLSTHSLVHVRILEGPGDPWPRLHSPIPICMLIDIPTGRYPISTRSIRPMGPAVAAAAVEAWALHHLVRRLVVQRTDTPVAVDGNV